MVIKVYSAPICPYCNAVKQYLKEKNVEFEDIDVSKDAKARETMIRKSGQRGVPVIDINGNIIIGFDKEKIDKALGLL